MPPQQPPHGRLARRIVQADFFTDLCEPPPYLGNLQGMLQPRVKHICLTCPYNLRNPGQAAKSRGIEDSIAIALKWIPLIGGAYIMTPLLALLV